MLIYPSYLKPPLFYLMYVQQLKKSQWNAHKKIKLSFEFTHITII